jgi:hypothetical protein
VVPYASLRPPLTSTLGRPVLLPDMLKSIVLIPLLITSIGSHAEPAPTHCSSNEVVYFNCLVKGSKKIASVCGAGYDFEKKESGYLQYRFGALQKLEFQYPASTYKEEMKDKFNFSAGRTADYVQWDFILDFSNNDYSYSIYYSEERKPHNKIVYSSSVTVWQDNDRKNARVLTCKNGKAGANLSLNHVIPLMSSPGRSWSEQRW